MSSRSNGASISNDINNTKLRLNLNKEETLIKYIEILQNLKF